MNHVYILYVMYFINMLCRHLQLFSCSNILWTFSTLTRHSQQKEPNWHQSTKKFYSQWTKHSSKVSVILIQMQQTEVDFINSFPLDVTNLLISTNWSVLLRLSSLEVDSRQKHLCLTSSELLLACCFVWRQICGQHDYHEKYVF